MRVRSNESAKYPAFTGMIMSGNVHAPNDFLMWFAMVLENLALSLLAVPRRTGKTGQ